MQYVLGLAILCKKYKKNPIARLFVNNQFIDEFIIDDTTKLFNDTIWITGKDERKEFSRVKISIYQIIDTEKYKNN